jgi:hypothetical protein
MPLANVSRVGLSVLASHESSGSTRGFQLSSDLASVAIPALVSPSDGAVDATVTPDGMRSGAYTVTARAVNAVGHVDTVGVSVSFGVELDVPTSRLGHTLTPFVNVSNVTVGVSTSDVLSPVGRLCKRMVVSGNECKTRVRH